MVGSEKQIAWAEQLKTKFYSQLSTLKANLEAGKQPGYFKRFNPVYFEILAEIEAEAASQESASWWINGSLGRNPEPWLAAVVRRRQS